MNTLAGETGNDFLQGGYANDVYVYNVGDANDVIVDLGGTDKILFGAGITANDLSFIRTSNNDLAISIDTGAGVSSILIQDFFQSAKAVETIEFSDTSTLNLTTINNWVLTGTGSADTLYGVENNGGADDTIFGGGGHDKISESASDKTLTSKIFKKWMKDNLIKKEARGVYRFIAKSDTVKTADFAFILEAFAKGLKGEAG